MRKIITKGAVKMKKRILIIISIILMMLSALTVFAQSGSESYSWYCIRRQVHLQPKCAPELSFIERYDGYYVDKFCGDQSDEKVIYLTFDAGYENGNVSKILDVLKEQKVPAAFFVLGNLIKSNPELIARMFNEGHLVCNHTYSHDPMLNKSEEEIKNELAKLEETCLNLTGKEMSKYYRPPEGRFSEQTLNSVKNLGYKTIFWSFAYADWDNNSQPSKEKALKKILDNVHNGEIMLLHPTSETNANILNDVIDSLLSEGYRFGTLDELCGK
jgi:peptidoglycan-N-acetylmuramic acid deacetylase